VLRSPLDFFGDHFVGRPMAAAWTPPTISARGGRRRTPDFVSWMLSAPVISGRAKEALAALLAPHAEILPLPAIHGHELHAVNVLRLVDCLDEAGSQITYTSNEPRRIVNVFAFALRKGCVPDVPIFKLAAYPVDVFVTRPFVDVVRDAKLTGAAFADPKVNPFPLLRDGRSVNVVED